MPTTDQRTAEHRAAVIAGLRALADFLTANPAVPLPINPITVAYFPRRAADAQMCAEIDRIASLLGAPVDSTHLDEWGQYMTGLEFGPIHYEAIAVLADARARHEALVSYTDCVIPDTDTTNGPAHAA